VPIGNIGAQAQQHFLTKLDLSGCEINHGGSVAIAQMLKRNTTLGHLRLFERTLPLAKIRAGQLDIPSVQVQVYSVHVPVLLGSSTKLSNSKPKVRSCAHLPVFLFSFFHVRCCLLNHGFFVFAVLLCYRLMTGRTSWRLRSSTCCTRRPTT
jgi:hypothetical protein